MRGSSRRRAAAISTGAVVLAACGWWEAALPPFHLGSTVVTLSVAAAVLVTGALYGRRSPTAGPGGQVGTASGPSPTPGVSEPAGKDDLCRRGRLAWALAALLAVAVELWELAHGPRRLYPTLSSLANELVGPGHRIARTAAFVFWGACGFVLVSGPARRP